MLLGKRIIISDDLPPPIGIEFGDWDTYIVPLLRLSIRQCATDTPSVSSDPDPERKVDV